MRTNNSREELRSVFAKSEFIWSILFSEMNDLENDVIQAETKNPDTFRMASHIALVEIMFDAYLDSLGVTERNRKKAERGIAEMYLAQLKKDGVIS